MWRRLSGDKLSETDGFEKLGEDGWSGEKLGEDGWSGEKLSEESWVTENVYELGETTGVQSDGFKDLARQNLYLFHKHTS